MYWIILNQIRFQDEEGEDEGAPERLEVVTKSRRSRKKSITLPPKKRSHAEKSGGKSGMTEDEIKKATMAALAAKPIVIGLERIKKKLTQSEEERAAVSVQLSLNGRTALQFSG